MGLEHQRIKQRFDLRDIGLFEGRPLKGATIVADIATDSLNANGAAFVAFDHVTAEVKLCSATRQTLRSISWPLYDSVAARVCETGACVGVSDLAEEAPSAGERTKLGVSAVLASPVIGPDDYPIGAFAVFDTKPRKWTRAQHRKLDNFAYLVTQEITLLSSLATLKLMAKEIDPFRVQAQSSEQ